MVLGVESEVARGVGGEPIEVIPTKAALGAEIIGVDLKNLDASQFAAIKRAWHDHQVILVRGQTLSDQDLIAFSRRFGDLDWAPVHGAAVIPQHEVADPPDMLPGKFWACDQIPQLIEQRLGLRKLEACEIRIAPAAEIEHEPPGVGVGADQRMHRTRRYPRIVGRGDTLAQIAAAVIGAVVLDL